MRLLTNTVPLSPWRSVRALGTPLAYNSTLNPAGAFNFAIGSLSAAAGSGGGTIGARLARSAASGRPCAHDGGASGGGVCCDAAGEATAASVPMVPASNRPHRVIEQMNMVILPLRSRSTPAQTLVR